LNKSASLMNNEVLDHVRDAKLAAIVKEIGDDHGMVISQLAFNIAEKDMGWKKVLNDKLALASYKSLIIPILEDDPKCETILNVGPIVAVNGDSIGDVPSDAVHSLASDKLDMSIAMNTVVDSGDDNDSLNPMPFMYGPTSKLQIIAIANLMIYDSTHWEQGVQLYNAAALCILEGGYYIHHHQMDGKVHCHLVRNVLIRDVLKAKPIIAENELPMVDAMCDAKVIAVEDAELRAALNALDGNETVESCLAVNVAVFINDHRVDEAPQPNSNFMAMTNLEIEGSVRGCLWQIIEMLSTSETESIGFEDSFDTLCDGLVAQGNIEGLLDYTEARLDEVAKLLQGQEWGEWVAPHLSEAKPRTRSSARSQVERRAATCFNVCSEMMDLSEAFNE
jgi:hypothetical protein